MRRKVSSKAIEPMALAQMFAVLSKDVVAESLVVSRSGRDCEGNPMYAIWALSMLLHILRYAPD